MKMRVLKLPKCLSTNLFYINFMRDEYMAISITKLLRKKQVESAFNSLKRTVKNTEATKLIRPPNLRNLRGLVL